MPESLTQESNRTIKLHESWLSVLQDELDASYMRELSDFLRQEKQLGKTIYPAGDDIFRAFNSTPLDSVRVIILGQDPYHGPKQAHGLSFSVPLGITIPPSLRNIYRELVSDCGISRPEHGHLQGWADQGVLLLNSVLTVEAGSAASHQGKGWEKFTDAVIECLNRQASGLVFMLWGSYAQKKGAMIDRKRHLVLQAPHPSPLSAHRGFLGCKHFSLANDYLSKSEKPLINWQL